MDFLATKGIEYLLVIVYLAVLVPLGWWLGRVSRVETERRVPAAAGRWFAVPPELHYHRGHTWVRPEGGETYRVGMDDFSQRLLGPANELRLPSIGESLRQGENGWQLRADGEWIDLLSPIDGDVVAVNDAVLSNPELPASDPYGRGWLLIVQGRPARHPLRNLLGGRLAQAWMTQIEGRVSDLAGPELGAVLQDGGLPVHGFVRELAGKRWREVAEALLLTNDRPAREVRRRSSRRRGPSPLRSRRRQARPSAR